MAENRSTKQKRIILEKINNFNSFFNAEELLLEAKKEYKKIGIATIYRLLKELQKDNKIYSYKCDRKTIYSKENKSHCHFICEETGKIIHFNIDSLDFLKDKIPGSISSFQLEVRGRCNKHSKNN
jgi:Fe2+ or Zn2+ uptake regulation protein